MVTQRYGTKRDGWHPVLPWGITPTESKHVFDCSPIGMEVQVRSILDRISFQEKYWPVKGR